MIHRNLVGSVGEVDHQRATAAEQTAALRLVAEVLGVADEGAVVDHRTAGCTREMDCAASCTRVDRAVVAGKAAAPHGDRGVVRVDGGALRIGAAPAPMAFHTPFRRQDVKAVGHEERPIHQGVLEVDDVEAEAAVVVTLRDVAVAGEDAVRDDERAVAVGLHIHATAVRLADCPAVCLDNAVRDLESALAGPDEAVAARPADIQSVKDDVVVGSALNLQNGRRCRLAIKDRKRTRLTLVKRRLSSREAAADGKCRIVRDGERRRVNRARLNPYLAWFVNHSECREEVRYGHRRPPTETIALLGDLRLRVVSGEDVEGRGNHIAQKRSLAGRRHRRDSNAVVVRVFDVKVRAHNVSANRPGLRVDDIRHRELRAVDVARIVDIAGDRQNHQRRYHLERDVIEEERGVGVVDRPPLEPQRVLSWGQDHVFDASVSDITARGRLLGIDDLAIKQHLVVQLNGSVPVAAMLAFPGKAGAARGFIREDLLHGTGLLEHSAPGAGDEGRGPIRLVAVRSIDNGRQSRVRTSPAGLQGAGLEAAVKQEIIGDEIVSGQFLAFTFASHLAGRSHGAISVGKTIRNIERSRARRNAALGIDPACASLDIRYGESRLRIVARHDILRGNRPDRPAAYERVVVVMSLWSGGESAALGQRRRVVADVNERRVAA